MQTQAICYNRSMHLFLDNEFFHEKNNLFFFHAKRKLVWDFSIAYSSTCIKGTPYIKRTPTISGDHL